VDGRTWTGGDGVRSITFCVYGTAIPQGSMRAFYNPKTQRMQKWDSNKNLKPWRQQLTLCAIEALKQNGGEIITKPAAVRIAVCFYLAKPPSVSKSRALPTVKPDSLKLCRSVEDSLSGILFEDDAQVTDHVIAKRYGSPERAEIQVEIIEDTAYKPDIAKELPLFAGVGS
jgi:Holliday junction resolvase RusA-like endonuclease